MDILETFLENLRDADFNVRLDAVSHIKNVARKLGAERTADELFPVFMEMTDAEDEVLTAIAKEVGGMLELVGGAGKAAPIIALLEKLCEVDETYVRDEAAKGICQVARAMNAESVSTLMVPLVKRLAEQDWFTARVSCAQLFAVTYERATASNRDELRSQFKTLAEDDMPMVRRQICKEFVNFVPVVEPEFATSDLVGIALALAKDDHDTVRALVMDAINELGKVTPSDTAVSELIPVVHNLVDDKSWRVRLAASKSITELGEIVGPDRASSEVTEWLAKLLGDSEAEVRSSAATALSPFCDSEMANADKMLEKMKGFFTDMANDKELKVRIAFAGSLAKMSTLCGSEKTIEELLPLWVQLLRDADSEVRLVVLEGVPALTEVVGVDMFRHHILGTVLQMAQDKQWRVRLNLVDLISVLSRSCGIEFFQENLKGILKDALADGVAKVREQAVKGVLELTEIFGVDWVCTEVVPDVLELFEKQTYYLHRMTALHAINELAGVLGSTFSVETMLPVVLKALKDPIPNVRFVGCRVAKTLANVCDAGSLDRDLKPLLTELADDSDGDVRFYAQAAAGAF